MTADQLRALRDAQPFRPFTVHLTDGRTFAVPHRDFVSQSPGGRLAIVYRSDDSFSIIDLCLVTELSVQTSAESGNGTTPGAGS
jgi:hypothetical protein